MTVEVPAYAKINLSLYVLGRRPDGYHDISSVMQLVSLHDTLTFNFDAPEYSLTCDHPQLANSDDNLVTRAVRALERAAARPIRVAVRLTKRIPLGAGLGGGSSDAAVTLRTLHDRLALGLPPGRLFELADDLGSDVPFFLTSGQALAEGRGEQLSELDLPTNYHVCIAFPGRIVSAREGYAQARISLTNPLSHITIGRFSTPESYVGWVQTLANDLEPGVSQLVPEVAQGVRAMRELGAIHAAMTGSGSAVFGIFPEPLPGDMAKRWPATGSWQVFTARPVRVSGLSTVGSRDE